MPRTFLAMSFGAIAVLFVFLPTRGIDYERACGQADPRSSLFWALLASGQIVMGTSKNSQPLSEATELPSNDSGSFSLRFGYVPAILVVGREHRQFFEVP